MQLKAEKLLNPKNYHLSFIAKKRLRWIYPLYNEKQENVTKTANKAGISRQWLSGIKSIFEKNNRDPRSLEPQSRAPHKTSKRKKISREKEDKILEVRDKYGWGKEKISAFLFNEYGIKVHPNTANKYLHIHKKISPKLSLKNLKAFKDKNKGNQKELSSKLNSDLRLKLRTMLPEL